MALLKPTPKPEKITVEVDNQTLNRAKQYCEFVGLDLSSMVNQSLDFVMKKDKDFKKKYGKK